MTRCISAVLLTATICLAGCDRIQPKPELPYDSGRAKEVLIDALETWKAGKAQTLRSRKPPVRLVDDDQLEGAKLMEYHLADPEQPIQSYENVPVVLKLRRDGGQVQERPTVYQVTLEPEIAVLRAE